MVTWDGKSWNISNNALFQARFEKYLNAPPAISPPETEYQATLEQIMEKLSAGKVTPRSIDEAFRLLAQASQYREDANLCDSIANQVYSAWLARKSNDRLNAASKALEDERKRLEWNARLTAEGTKLEGGASGKSKDGAVNEQVQQQQQLGREMQMQPILTAACLGYGSNQSQSAQARGGRTSGEDRVSIPDRSAFPSKALPTRLDPHAIYRSIFADGDGQLRVGEDANNLFAKTSGLPQRWARSIR